jgi:hypothetical protein
MTLQEFFEMAARRNSGPTVHEFNFNEAVDSCWPDIEAVLKAVDRARSVDHNFQCLIHTSKVACSCGLTALDNAYHELESKIKGM